MQSEIISSVTRIYDASINQAAWASALTEIASVTGAKASVLLVRDRDGGPYQISALSERYAHLIATEGLEYLQKYAHFELPDWVAFDQIPSGDPQPDTALGLTADERDARPDHVFLRNQFGIRRRLGTRLNDNPVWFDVMTTLYDADIRAVPDQAYAQTRLLVPHLAKSVQIGRMFAQLQRRYKAILSVLDRINIGLAIALPNGELITANTATERIFLEDDGITIGSNRRLVTPDPDVRPHIESAIQRASDTARGTDDKAEETILIPRKSQSAPYVIDVSPLRDSKNELDTDLTGALLILIDPEYVPDLPLERFVQLYGLTSAESDVTQLLLQGLGAADIADTRNTTQNTAKNQIASVYAKAGVKNRSALVRLILRVLPPIIH